MRITVKQAGAIIVLVAAMVPIFCGTIVPALIKRHNLRRKGKD